MKKGTVIFWVIFVISIVFLIVYSSIKQIKIERDIIINFEVYKVETTPAMRSVLFDKKGNKLRLQRFVFFKRHDIKPGDIIVKDKGSDVLKVYRTDSLGVKRVHLIMTLD